MKNENYYVGLDIGTDSVGYAVTDEKYDLCKHNGEPMWGVTLFDPAELANKRRSFRAARRRLDRRQHRVKLLMELFAREVSKVDDGFFKRIKESYLYPGSNDQKIRLFGSYDEQKEYTKNYPTIHHLIKELMESTEPHDVRLVYIACAWLVAHRGHFLSEVDKHKIEDVIAFDEVWKRLNEHIAREGRPLPWIDGVNSVDVEEVLKEKLGISKKTAALAKKLFDGGKPPKEIGENYEYNYALVLKLLCGGKENLKALFGKDEYEELEKKSIALNTKEEDLEAVMQSIDESDAEFIKVLKAVYDWSVLADILKGEKSISKAKVEVYEQHKKDLKTLKDIIKEYIPQKYDDIFRSETTKGNYVSYVGKNKIAGESVSVKKETSQEDFCKYVLSAVKSIKPKKCDQEKYDKMIARLDSCDFMPKQVDGDNRVIPYQLYWYELNEILEKAKSYIPFLSEADADGITGAEKILSVFEFRVPYFVGPLKENLTDDRKLNHWMVRKVEKGIKNTGPIYPWNFTKVIDLEASEDAFIKRMTNSCTYLPGEDVLPKNSLIYSAFEVLNEINNIRIDDKEIPVSVKQSIYDNVFMAYDKVTVERIKKHLESSGLVNKGNYILSGLNETVNSSLKSFRIFKNLVSNGYLTYSDAEKIIHRATYSEDKIRFKDWLRREYPHLPESEITYISGKKFKEFGRLSRKLLCGIEGAVNKDTGEYMTIIRTMWETNLNLMQILYSDKFEFLEKIEEHTREYYGCEKRSLTERLDDMYVSNTVKRQIIRTFDILKDIKKVQKNDPKMIFIEMARGATEEQKGKRTKTRLDQIREFYDKIDTEDVRELSKQLDEWGDTAHNKLQSDKIFLYFMQLGKCLYTGDPIDLDSVLSGNGKYNIDHIRPRCYVKDDSVINNLVLVDSKENDRKGDNPVPSDIISNPKTVKLWKYLNSITVEKGKLLSDEKLKRLMRTTPFTDEERYEFINRQLVETRQSTKVVASLLKELYPNTEIVYVKASLASDFRRNFKKRRPDDENYQEFDLPKSRTVNDLHHAKDAYLNIVVGNVWHHKFSKQYYKKNDDNNVKAEVLFTHKLVCNGKVIWNGAEDKERVVKIARKNTGHITVYPYCKHSGQNGGFFNQNPLKAQEGLIPLKKGMPTEIYGGYDSATVAGFILVRYTLGKKTEVSFVPLKFLFMKKFIEDDDFALEYIKKELGEKATNIEILLNKRIIKIFTMLSLDGARFCIRGKASPKEIGLMNVMPFMTSPEFEAYIKKLESLKKKHDKNENLVWDERYDGVSESKNLILYKHLIDKLSAWPYNKRPGVGVFCQKLEKRVDDFEKLDIFKQTDILLTVLGVLGRIKNADLKPLGESSDSGTAQLSLNLHNWKKNYTDVRIIDQSASGLFETISDVNLLDLL